MLKNDEIKRYDRQIMLDEIGRTGQEKLKGARVFIAGAGGLGSPVSIYLAVAGVGKITIVDHDTVSLSNLNRQILHRDEDVGRSKVASAGEKLKGLNPSITVECICETITDGNVSGLVGEADLIVDAMDNMPVRYLLNRVAVEKNIPFFHGAVNGFEGRVMTVIPGQTACLRCMYKGPVKEEKFAVIGTTPGVIGSIQAAEVIKYITGAGDLLLNRLLMYDGCGMTFTEFKVKRNKNCQHCGVD